MCLGGNNLIRIFRSLFHSEQAPYFLNSDQKELVKNALKRYKQEKLYCLPDATLSEVADRLEVEYVYIYRYFAQKDTDFRTWRTSLRIEEAKRLMKIYPDEPMSVIGRRVGIYDRSNFCRQFKELVGETPQKWKKSKK